MPPNELGELKNQLRELLDRDFTHPSSFPRWCPLCLLIRRITPSSSWTSDCEEAFQKLKTLSTTVPILTQPDVTQPFDIYRTYPNPTGYHQTFRYLLRCIRNWSWMCLDARMKGHCLCLASMEETRRALSNPWSRASSSGSRSKDLATLPLRQCLSCLHGP